MPLHNLYKITQTIRLAILNYFISVRWSQITLWNLKCIIFFTTSQIFFLFPYYNSGIFHYTKVVVL